MSASIRVGVGGWTFEPWRDNFYPAGWPHARELDLDVERVAHREVERHASRRVARVQDRAVEIEEQKLHGIVLDAALRECTAKG